MTDGVPFQVAANWLADQLLLASTLQEAVDRLRLYTAFLPSLRVDNRVLRSSASFHDLRAKIADRVGSAMDSH